MLLKCITKKEAIVATKNLLAIFCLLLDVNNLIVFYLFVFCCCCFFLFFFVFFVFLFVCLFCFFFGRGIFSL